MDVIIIHMRIIAVDSLWPDDAIWLYRTGPALTLVRVCFVTAASIDGIITWINVDLSLVDSCNIHARRGLLRISVYSIEFWNYTFKITASSSCV